MRSPRRLAVGLERELAVRSRTTVAELALRRAARSGRRILVGPFLGEVGYELLYWVPFVRRALHRLGVEPGQVTTLTRGGAGSWYSDFAESHVELFDVAEPGDLVARISARRRRARDAKQLRGDSLDRELVRLARERIGPATLFHPSVMFDRLRGLWFRDAPLSDILPQLEFRTLSPPRPPVGLPDEYVAVKLYASDCFPDEPAVRERARSLVERLAGESSVVLLTTGLRLDDHDEWADVPDVHRIDSLVTSQDNLAVQTAVVAGSRRLVSTYGGFSYLGPLLGVPTLAVHARTNFHPAHLDLARAAFAGTRYDVETIEDAAR